MLIADDSPVIPMVDAGQRHLIYGLLPSRVAVPMAPSWWYGCKRAADVALGMMLIIATAPLVIAAAITIMAVSRGSPIFSQSRVGKDGHIFKMYKLRTMVRGAHLLHDKLRILNEVSGPVFKIKADPRLISIGPFLRRYSVDELPNLWNVLLGDMSLVGPRPPLPSEVANYDMRAFRRLTVKPGVTCLWQVSGRSDLPFDEWIHLDNRYIDTWSPMLDLRIIARTVPVVLRGRGAY